MKYIKLILIDSFLLFFFIINNLKYPFKIDILQDSPYKNRKYWVGQKYKIKIKRYQNYMHEKISITCSKDKKVEINNEYILMKKSGNECLIAYTKKYNSTICFNIYNTPKLIFKEKNPIKIETYGNRTLYLDKMDYPLSNIKYSSNNPEIIKVNNKGKIVALRPGSAIIRASALDNQTAEIKVIVTSKNGFLNDYILYFFKANQYEKVMIVAHPDDETLWGGANLLKDNYFIICFTNGYNIRRAKDFKEVLKFTNNSGIILNYPDIEDNIIDNWSEVEEGILNDLFIIINYKSWDKIVTHGPEGTTGHIHHKKLSKYVTIVTKKLNKFNNLYYFGKFYQKKKITKDFPKITDNELKNKIKEVEIHKTEKKIIYSRWFHMLPYENWIKATRYEETIY